MRNADTAWPVPRGCQDQGGAGVAGAEEVTVVDVWPRGKDKRCWALL